MIVNLNDNRAYEHIPLMHRLAVMRHRDLSYAQQQALSPPATACIYMCHWMRRRRGHGCRQHGHFVACTPALLLVLLHVHAARGLAIGDHGAGHNYSRSDSGVFCGDSACPCRTCATEGGKVRLVVIFFLWILCCMMGIIFLWMCSVLFVHFCIAAPTDSDELSVSYPHDQAGNVHGRLGPSNSRGETDRQPTLHALSRPRIVASRPRRASVVLRTRTHRIVVAPPEWHRHELTESPAAASTDDDDVELDGERIWELIDRVREDLHELETMVETRHQRTRVIYPEHEAAPRYVMQHEEDCQNHHFWQMPMRAESIQRLDHIGQE